MTSKYAGANPYPRTYVGIDPGSSLGLVALVDEPDGTMSCRHALTLTRPAATRTRPRTLAELEQARLLALYLQTHTPDVCVIEEPWDVSDGWGKGGRRIGTGFRIGAAWAFAVSAVPPGVELTTYPVRGNAKTPGWMGGHKQQALARAEAAWAEVHGPAWHTLDEHQQAAAGVLLYHLGRLRRLTRTRGRT